MQMTSRWNKSEGVALLAEGVDRNMKRLRKAVKEPLVALLAEGVDRNVFEQAVFFVEFWSPSSRRAWIEMTD